MVLSYEKQQWKIQLLAEIFLCAASNQQLSQLHYSWARNHKNEFCASYRMYRQWSLLHKNSNLAKVAQNDWLWVIFAICSLSKIQCGQLGQFFEEILSRGQQPVGWEKDTRGGVAFSPRAHASRNQTLEASSTWNFFLFLFSLRRKYLDWRRNFLTLLLRIQTLGMLRQFWPGKGSFWQTLRWHCIRDTIRHTAVVFLRSEEYKPET